MSIKQPNKTKAIADVSTELSDNLKSAALFTVNDEGIIQASQEGVFLLNPSTITESKSSNWIPQVTPGQSDPPLQWISSGVRTVTFDALVTKETSDFVTKVETGKQKDPNIFQGSIASAFFKVRELPDRTISDPGPGLDISKTLDYYRSLLYPVYDNKIDPSRLRFSPPLVVFLVGNSLSNIKHGDRISTQTDVWVVTNLEIRITKQLLNLAPQEATVSFQLTHYNIQSFDRSRFLS